MSYSVESTPEGKRGILSFADVAEKNEKNSVERNDSDDCTTEHEDSPYSPTNTRWDPAQNADSSDEDEEACDSDSLVEVGLESTEDEDDDDFQRTLSQTYKEEESLSDFVKEGEARIPSSTR
jgi:hypothetical protein